MYCSFVALVLRKIFLILFDTELYSIVFHRNDATVNIVLTLFIVLLTWIK